MWARIHLIPALQAEEDRDQVRRYLADKAREKELLGSETKIYNSDRYVLEEIRPNEWQVDRWLQVRSTDLRNHAGTRDEIEGPDTWFRIASVRRVYKGGGSSKLRCRKWLVARISIATTGESTFSKFTTFSNISSRVRNSLSFQ